MLGMQLSPNRPRPRARPVSSMTPTLAVKDGRVVLAAGGSGGMTIATNVAQTVVSQLLFGTPADKLVAMPRFQIPVMGSTIKLPKGTKKEVIEDLKKGDTISVDDVQALFSER